MVNMKKLLMKQKFELEYILNTSLRFLFERLSTPGGLSEWFADDVNMTGDVLTFKWQGNEEKAQILNIKDNKSIRLKWLSDKDPKTFLEFRIKQDELTGDTALYIIDFADEEEKTEAINLWDSQIGELKHVIGL
jgi:uncharacterized protein YndB with AHSA1/START domain